MSKIFRKGRKYVFTKKKFVQKCVQDEEDWRPYKGWVNQCNGMEVRLISDYGGNVRGYAVIPDWCKEVPNGKHI